MLKIISRKSKLALTQANIIKNKIIHIYKKIKITGIKTKGDELSKSNTNIELNTGIFIKELEKELFKNKADLAVHSAKDMPTKTNKLFKIKFITKRKDPRDSLVSFKYKKISLMPLGSIIGTSSERRKSQILSIRPDIKIEIIKGNIISRIKKLKKNRFDALILASSGLKRLFLKKLIKENLNIKNFTPSMGQGSICIEYKKNNTQLKNNIQKVINKFTSQHVTIERKFNNKINGGCLSPIGTFIYNKSNTKIKFFTFIGSKKGEKIISLEKIIKKIDLKNEIKKIIKNLNRKKLKKILKL